MKKYINIKYWILGWIFVLLGFVNVTFAQTADLTTHQPSGITFEWHNALPISASNLIASPTAVIPGLYFGVYNFGTCYSEAAPIRVATNTCPVTTVDLNSFVETTGTPSGMTLTFHNASPVSDANRLSGSAITAAATAVTYYVAYIDNIVGCYSKESMIVVVNSSCLAAIVAVADTPSTLPGTNTPSVILNDTVNGLQAVIGTAAGQVTLSFTNSGPLTMNVDGTIAVAANTPAGTYTITYTICEVNNLANCSAPTTVTVTVTAPAIVAVADTPSVLPGTNTPSVILNDTVNGVQAVIGTAPGQVTLTSTPNGPLTMNVDGTIAVAANTPAGTYSITYTICEVNNLANCSAVTSNVTVNLPPTTIWTGTTSTAWNDATNWSSGIPLLGSRLEIPGGLINYPILDQTRTIGDAIIADGATLNLNNFTLVVSGTFSGTGTLIGSATSGLTLNGSGSKGTFYMNQTTPGISNKVANFTLNAISSGSTTLGNDMGISGILTLTNGTFNTGGNLTLTSNGIGTAVVAPITDCNSIAITGDVTVERFFPAGRAFRLITSPVTTTSTIRDNWQEGVSNPTTSYANNLNPHLGYGTHITGNMTNGAIYGFDATQTTNNSMFTFNNTTRAWAAVPNTNLLTLTAGVPYRLMIRGDRSIDMITNAPTATNTILRAKGALKICDAPAGGLGENAGDLSFIGNPYQAIVDIKSVLQNSTNLNSNSYYVWDPKLNTRGAYVTFDLNSNINSVLGSAVNAYLQPWQACYVTTTSAGSASIMFHESNKSPLESVIEGVYRTNNLASYIRLTLYESNILANNGTATDGLIMKFGDNYVNAIDGNDAVKLSNQDETFSTKNNTTLLGIESRLFPLATDVIPLNITQYRFTNYTMVANGTNMSGLPAYLHDQLLQTYTEIPQSGSVNYSYMLNTNNTATSASNRFRIVFQNPTLSMDFNAALAFTMYPNPSKQGVFDVVMNDATEDTKLIIYNSIGQEVYATNLTQTTINHIDPNKIFANGIYYVKIIKDATKSIKKLIIR